MRRKHVQPPDFPPDFPIHGCPRPEHLRQSKLRYSALQVKLYFREIFWSDQVNMTISPDCSHLLDVHLLIIIIVRNGRISTATIRGSPRFGGGRLWWWQKVWWTQTATANLRAILSIGLILDSPEFWGILSIRRLWNPNFKCTRIVEVGNRRNEHISSRWPLGMWQLEDW